MGWACSWDGNYKTLAQNLEGETFLKTAIMKPIIKWENDMKKDIEEMRIFRNDGRSMELTQ